MSLNRFRNQVSDKLRAEVRNNLHYHSTKYAKRKLKFLNKECGAMSEYEIQLKVISNYGIGWQGRAGKRPLSL